MILSLLEVGRGQTKCLPFRFLLFPVWVTCCLLSILPLQAQDLSYRRYTLRDGLPGSVVYHCLQDRNGFLWFATNKGVSRFDGRTFRNFTVQDGLPENDIIKLHIDRYNNIWFVSLSGIPAVYSEGTITKLDCRGIVAIMEDKVSDSIMLTGVFWQNNERYYGYAAVVKEAGKWRLFDRFRKILRMKEAFQLPVLRASVNGANFYFAVTSEEKSELRVKVRQREAIYGFSNSKLQHYVAYTATSFVASIPRRQAIVFHNLHALYYADIDGIRELFSLEEIGINVDKLAELNYLYVENDSTLWLCTRNRGLIRATHFMKPERTFDYFFPGSFCTSFLKDAEGGYWLSTLNQGTIYLPNLNFFTLSGNPAVTGKDVRCLQSIGAQSLAAGFADGTIAQVHVPDSRVTVLEKWGAQNKNNRVLDIQPWGRDLLVGSDVGLYVIAPGQVIQKQSYRLAGIKGLLIESDSTALIATASDLCRYKRGNDTLSKFIYESRATCVVGNRDRYAWGTLNGAYLHAGDSTTGLGDLYPALSGSINYLALPPDSAIWAATPQGVVVLKDGHAQVIKEENGLLGSACRHLFLDDTTAWVATDKGIARIDYHWQGKRLAYSVINITENDGLISDDVNQVITGGPYLWAATNRGISFFSKHYRGNVAIPPYIVIDRIMAGHSVIPMADTIFLDHRQNNLTIEISGVAYRNASNIQYRYRLLGLDSSWYPIINNNISFSALPYGAFTLEIGAYNLAKQALVAIRDLKVINTPPFWQSRWGLVLIYLISIALIGSIFYLIYRRQQRKKEELARVNQRILDLEVMALRAQMDPHFIFNCLNSIQHYILTADVVNANGYLHRFSTLIRKTLQLGPSSVVSLKEELEMLELYLELEQMRLGDRMEYRIMVDQALDQEEITIPAMIIQPYVENAVKHGIAPLRDRKGMLTVEFRLVGDDLVCEVVDNGIGIRASLDKQAGHVYRHVSMGQNITESRLQAMNSIRKNKIKLMVTDRQELDPPANGTFVQIIFPPETD